MPQNPLYNDPRQDVRPFDFHTLTKQVATPPAAPVGQIDFLLTALNRLEETIDLETSALRALDASATSEFNSRKSQSLLELDRAQKLLRDQALPQPLKARLQGLQTKLENNRWLLLLHLEAVREVASVIASAMRDAESDGTYCQAKPPVKQLRK